MLSADGGRVAFATWIGGKNILVVDGKLGDPYDFVDFPPAMSDDGSVVAYAARLGSEQFCVVNGRRGPAFRDVGSVVLSPDGTSVAYAARDEEGASVVLNGKRGATFSWVGEPVLSPDGRDVAYCAEKGAAHVVAGGRMGPAFERVTRPAYGADGRTGVYAGRRDGRWSLVVGSRKIPVEGEVVSVFAGRRAGYVEQRGSKVRVRVPGEPPGPEVDEVRWPRIGADGRLVYFAVRGSRNYLVAGTEEVLLGEGAVWDPVFEEGGRRVRFDMKIGRELWRKTVALRDAAPRERN